MTKKGSGVPSHPLILDTEDVRAWGRVQQKELAANKPLIKEVLGKLRSANAFERIPACRCERKLLELKIAEALALQLRTFQSDKQDRERREREEHLRDNYSTITRRLKDASRKLKRSQPLLAGVVQASGEVLEIEANKLSKALESEKFLLSERGRIRAPRLSRDAEQTGLLVAYVFTILWHTTSASRTRILRDVLPPILEAFSEAYREFCPARGFGDPEVGLWRFEKKRQVNAGSKGRLGFWQPFLFVWDSRFSPSLFSSRRTLQAPSR